MVVGPKKACRTSTTVPATNTTANTTAATVTSPLRLRFTGVSIIGKVTRLRNAVHRERYFGARTGVVGRLTCVHAAPEAEGVIEERLQDLGGRDVGDQRVVVGAVGHDLALGHQVLLDSRKHLRQVVP